MIAAFEADERATLPALIAAQARCHPERLALREGSRVLTFAELLSRSDGLAAALRAGGSQPGDVVAIALPRSLELMVACGAVLRAGCVVLTLDPTAPIPRLRQLVSLAGAKWSIARGPTRLDALDGTRAFDITADASPVDGPASAREPGDAAFLVFTSGSTGTPKGVLLSHAAVVARLTAEHAVFPYRSDDRQLHCAVPGSVGLAVDSAALALGVPVTVASDQATLAPAELAAAIRDGGVTRGTFSPRMLEALLALPQVSDDLGCMRLIRSSGEAPPANLAERLHSVVPSCRLVNVYGMTETAGDVTVAEFATGDDASFLAGRPLPGIRLRLDGAVEGTAEDGEVWICSPTLARGYLDPEASAAPKFVGTAGTDEGAPERWYRSGDRGRWTPDGRLEILGRMDLQLNVGGVRIDPVEIENALRRHPAVRDAAVWAHHDAEGRSRLVAYVVDDASPAPTAALRRFLAAELPSTAVPSRVVRLVSLPRTPTGKLNRPMLPTPEVAGVSATEPRTALEQQMLAVFRDVLGAPCAGLQDDFFDLGGDSLGAAQFLAGVSTIVGTALPAAMILDAPTVEEMARTVGRYGERQVAAVHLREGAGLPPLWCLPGFVGDPLWFGPLLPSLDPRLPVIGISLVGLKPPISIEDATARCLDELRAVQPSGPYHLLGYSAGGVIAVELAAALRRRGDIVAFLGVIDTTPPTPNWSADRAAAIDGQALDRLRYRARLALARLVRFHLRKPLLSLGVPVGRVVPTFVADLPAALRRHSMGRFDLELTLFRAANPPRREDPYLGWGPYAGRGVRVVDIPGNHLTLLRSGRHRVLGARIDEALEEARGR